MAKKVVLITGASSGMGKITAKDLIQKGNQRTVENQTQVARQKKNHR